MKKWMAGASALAVLLGGAAHAEDVTLQLKWVTQAQFAGYYVAKDKGFYEEEGLNVTIKPGGPDVAPAQVIAGGGADVGDRLDALGARRAREGAAARQHRPAVQELGDGADLPQRLRA